MLKRQASRSWWFVLLVLGLLGVQAAPAQESTRRVHAGDAMPAFSLADAEGTSFAYDANHPGVLGLVVMKTGQDHFSRVVADLKKVTAQLRPGRPAAFDCVIVVSGPGAGEFVRAQTVETDSPVRVLLDPDFALWGRLGIIAAPTAIVVGADRQVQWTQAGYGYDFIPAFHAQMGKALGLDRDAEASVRVETLENASDRARLERHVQMGRMLAERGRLTSAIEEFRRARALDPNAIDVVLELGELLCRAGENQAAFDLAATTEAQAKTDPQRARILLIRGWAQRQMGQLDEAEALLSKAAELGPRSARTFYELGKVYQEKGDLEKAVSCYRQALARVFEEVETPAPRPQ